MKLALNALVKFLCGLLLLSALLFVPAGTLAWPQAWLFLGCLFLPMLLMGIALLVKSPDLLRKRLNSREKQKAQKGVVAGSALLFLAIFTLAGLDFRFGWTQLPLWGCIAAAVAQLAGYALYAEVMRENAYLSRTVEVQAGQKVIDTGLYGIVRHPMYLATILLFCAMPLTLGSLWAFLPALAYPALLVARIRSEEKLLTQELNGYADYCKKVKYHLIPYIW